MDSSPLKLWLVKMIFSKKIYPDYPHINILLKSQSFPIVQIPPGRNLTVGLGAESAVYFAFLVAGLDPSLDKTSSPHQSAMSMDQKTPPLWHFGFSPFLDLSPVPWCSKRSSFSSFFITLFSIPGTVHQQQHANHATGAFFSLPGFL